MDLLSTTMVMLRTKMSEYLDKCGVCILMIMQNFKRAHNF